MPNAKEIVEIEEVTEKVDVKALAIKLTAMAVVSTVIILATKFVLDQINKRED
jgi:hypothetical protein